MTAGAVLLVHRHPGVGDDAIRTGNGLLGLMRQQDVAAIVARPVQELVEGSEPKGVAMRIL